MTKEKSKYTIEQLINDAKQYIANEDEIKIIRDAYNFATEKHEGQSRATGEPYIMHPLETARILTTIYADYQAICAGLLHDVIEDCMVNKQELAEKFGNTIADLVDGVSKISKIHFSTENEALIEYYKKIIVGMSEDVRVIIIKLADRLHNMRTLFALKEEKQKKIAKETLEILIPIAHHLGIQKIKSELEDLALRHIKPDVFFDIVERLNATKLERDNAVNEMINTVSGILNDHAIVHQIKGRSKSIYSIYTKLEKGKKFSDIYDLLALRILVDKEEECYSIIGIIHSKFRPISNRFKDYIAMPKGNGYQSLHTTVLGVDGYLFEVQIRTHEMDEIAENGVASHWSYKQKKDMTKLVTNTTEAKLQFFKSIIELNEERMSSEEFVNSVKDELLHNNIYVFTPKGDIFELPKGSTPIDFAYKIHSDVGDTMIGAIVNNNIVQLNYELQNNDVIKINTSRTSQGPSKEWINIAYTTQAKSKIRTFFAKSEKEKNIEKGKVALEKELRKRRIPFNDFLTDENTEKILKDVKLPSLEDLYLYLGSNKIGIRYVIGIIHKDNVNELKLKEVPKEIDAAIIVEGIDNIKVNLANCCNPVPGDAIVGYITKANGISVHRNNCPNLAYLDDRMISVKWNDNAKNKKYLATIVITLEQNDRAILDIMKKANSLGVITDSMSTINKQSEITYELDIWVKDTEHINTFIRDISNLSYINNVTRVIR